MADLSALGAVVRDALLSLPGDARLPASAVRDLVRGGVASVNGATGAVTVTLQQLGGAPSANPAFSGTVRGVTKSHVGLGDVDNTSDLDKPISTAVAAALAPLLASAPARTYDTVAALLAGTETLAVGATVAAGGYRYLVTAANVKDHHLTTAGGAKLRVLVGNAQTIEAFSFYGGDWGSAITAASAALSAAGGGVVALPPGTLTFDQCVLHRRTLLAGAGAGATCLRQRNGANRDFIVSENFAALTGSGRTLAETPLCPSFLGLANLRIDGGRRTAANPAGNVSGRAVAFYGAAILFQGSVLVHDGAGGGLHTEYGVGLGSTGWEGQEEGDFGSVTVRDCGGPAGWLFRGPHNTRISRIVACYNDGWGFRSEGLPYDGGIDYIGAIHTYANGRGAAQAADTGLHLGAIARIGMMMTDGDNAEIAASGVQISVARCYNAGGAMDGLIVSGNNVAIGHLNLEGWPRSAGRALVRWTGGHGSLGGLTLTTGGPDNDGLVIDGAEGNFANLDIRGCSAAGRAGLRNNASGNRISGRVSGCAIGFQQAAGQSNTCVALTIGTAAGQRAVAGASPNATDIFEIRAHGPGQAGRTFCAVQTAAFAADDTTPGTITVAHGLLYPPARQAVALTLLQSAPDSAAIDLAYLRVNAVDATNVTIGYRFNTPAPSGTRVRVGVTARIA